MNDDVRPAWLLSTPMIKGELYSLLQELAPEKKWPKSTKLKDFIDFTVQRFDTSSSNRRELRALELAQVIRNCGRASPRGCGARRGWGSVARSAAGMQRAIRRRGI